METPIDTTELEVPATAPAATPIEDLASDPSALSVDQVRLALRRVKDPELNLNIVDLGLVYEIRTEGSKAIIDMSLTSPGCPSGPEIMKDAEDAIRTVDGVTDAVINLVWSPPWTPERIEPRVRAYLGF
jgi:metal-sulfur cluster biosynthetic enzyme